MPPARPRAAPPDPEDAARLSLTGASGRVARLLRPWLPGAAFVSRGEGPLPGRIAGRSALVALGGVTSGDAKALEGNTAAALDALEAARAAGVPRVLILSSSAVYGRADGPLDETMPPTPANPYGAAKAEMEAAIARWRSAHPRRPETCILRLGNVAGADALLGGLDPERRPRLDTWPDGSTPLRGYVGPVTLARVLAELALHPLALPPVLNLAADPVEMGALLRAVGRDWDAVPAPAQALRAVRLDTTRLRALVSLDPVEATASELVAQWRASGGAA